MPRITAFVIALLLAILTSSATYADDKYPEGYEGMVKAAVELAIEQTRRSRVEAIINQFKAERNNRMPQDYEIRQELNVPGGNWNSPEGEAYNAIIEELLGQ